LEKNFHLRQGRR